MSKQHASDTPETDRYYREELGVYGKGFPSPCDFARRLERERDEWKSRVIAFNNQAERAVRSLETLEQERDQLRARVAELELNLNRATLIIERAMNKTSLGWTVPGFVEQFRRLLTKNEADKA